MALMPWESIMKEPIIYDGVLQGYRVYRIGTGILNTDQFVGYEWR